jgi:hypothetical protein
VLILNRRRRSKIVYPAPLANNTIAPLGDSRTDQMTYDTAKLQSEVQNHINWANMISGFRFFPTGEFALGGITTRTMFNTYLMPALASRPYALLILGGVNDFAAGFDPAETVANVIGCAEAARKRGVLAIICLDPGAENLTSAQCTALHGTGGVNDQWRAYGAAHPGQVVIVDWISTVLDTTNPVKWKTGYSVDGVHEDTPGAKAMGEFLNTTLAPYFPVPTSPSTTTGNVLTNADFATATGGGVGAGNLGTLPSGWTSLAGTSNGSVTASVSGTVMTVTAGTGIIRQGQRITGTGISSDVRVASFGTGTGGNGTANSANGTYNLSVSPGTLTSRTITVYDNFVTFSLNTRGDGKKEIVAVVEAASGITAAYTVQISQTVAGFTLTNTDINRWGCKVDVDAGYSGFQYPSTEASFTYTSGFDIGYLSRSSTNLDIPSDGAKTFTLINTIYQLPVGKTLSSTSARPMKARLKSGTARFREPWMRKDLTTTYSLT